jgi:pyruvate dehydrogenase kinase 2/3/4
LQITDEGGGIPRSGLSKISTYLYSTAENPPDLDVHNEGVTMTGYGYGIPISHLYARYFGGDLHIISMEGYGVYILNVLYSDIKHTEEYGCIHLSLIFINQ